MAMQYRTSVDVDNLFSTSVIPVLTDYLSIAADQTLKRGAQTLFDFLANGASAGYTTRCEIKNGSIVSTTGQWIAAMESSANTTSTKKFELDITNVSFSSEKNFTTPFAFAVWVNPNSPSQGIDLDVSYNGCTFDIT